MDIQKIDIERSYVQLLDNTIGSNASDPDFLAELAQKMAELTEVWGDAKLHPDHVNSVEKEIYSWLAARKDNKSEPVASLKYRHPHRSKRR